jgi:outer membrane protein OmpA-like peptidoglycan-associated protein
MNLSQQRAQSVTNYLSNKGIASNRLTTKWYGELQPKSDNSTSEGKAKNRRVEMVIVADENLKKEAIDKTQ